ncbi:MAG: GIY-YIG nuclease family protein [Pseudomonadota bacterium]|nr:GIY-YIG nuclease family protein [Pseudomonadota bacterium]
MSATAAKAGQAEDDSWNLYLIRTRQGSLYCGISKDVARRFREHTAGGAKCARALRGRGPLQLVFSCRAGSHRRALQLEYRVKQLSKAAKEALIRGDTGLPQLDV